MDRKEPVWHRETVDAGVEDTLDQPREIPILAPFYLADGTGLALHLGHRHSVDLDLFLAEEFDEDAILQKVQHVKEFALVEKRPGTIHSHIRQTKVSFLAYAYPVLFPFRSFHGVSVVDPRDIAGMKISAIASRGTKRDFVDLYNVSQHYGLKYAIEWFTTKFAKTITA